MDEPLVSVRGEAHLEVDPETARLNVVVRARDKHREDTLRRVDERQRAVLGLVESYGDAVDRVETRSVRLSPEFKDDRPNERILGYTGVVANTVTVVDFARLGDLVARLSELDLVEVNGPWWALRRTSPVYRDARIAAVGEAVRRARDYAEALGSRLTGVVELADVGLLTSGEPDGFAPGAPGAVPMAAMSMSARGAAEPVVLDLEPVRQNVHAAVEARFRMTAPSGEDL